MSSLTNPEYLDRHQGAAKLWQHFPDVFAVLPPSQQWQVHRYYQTQVDADPASLIRNRKQLTQAEPSLPTAASRSYLVLASAFRFASKYGQGDDLRFRQALLWFARQRIPATKRAPVMVFSVVRPDIDTSKLARAFIRLAEELARRDTPPPSDSDQADAA